jgi:Carboxypeptidase regulatory-like domain/TonB dependent receptor
MLALKNKLTYLFILTVTCSTPAFSQFTQTIRGTVLDKLLQTPVAGASIIIVSTQQAAITDSAGNFRFKNVPAGTYSLQVSHISFKEAVFGNIVVNTGKEVVLNFSMETNVQAEKAVVVTANSKKNRPLNDMNAVSARAFTVEETKKYAAAVNDPLRMATGFAGVMAADDGSNDIVIRGNSPTGLLWRMEGIDIPNPNHFSSAGSSGGGISILSAQLLSNSDFITGAFAAEYGNALSGVFDLSLRKGNNEKKEYTIEAGVLGLNVAAEGPLSPFYKGSYLVNYRYSTLALLDKIGVTLTDGNTIFQDLSYNIYLPTRHAGNFTFFGFGGLSSQTDDVITDPNKWNADEDRYGGDFRANTAATGITHTISLNYKTTLKSAVSYSYTDNRYSSKYAEDNGSISNDYKDSYKTRKWIASSTLNHKINNRNALRAGVIVDFIHFGYYKKAKDNVNAPLIERINSNGNTKTLQAFAQWQYKPLNNLAFNAGVHYLRLLYNNTASLEPRASVKWDNGKNSFALGYGLHSQIQPLGVYFAQDENIPSYHPNKDIKLTRAHHFVASYSRVLGKNLRFKTELYYQHLFHVPVTTDPEKTFSVLNIQNEFITDPLINIGKGRNYGVEFTVDQSLNNNIYYIINTSIFQSKYTAADGVERDTRFNSNYLVNAVAGKEFPLKGQRKVLGINIKVIYAGGFRTTPIDTEKSRQAGYAIYREKEAFSLQNPAYFRPDLRVSLKWNRKNLTSTLSLDLQNAINRLNIYGQYYDAMNDQVYTSYQNGLIPILNYRIEF